MCSHCSWGRASRRGCVRGRTIRRSGGGERGAKEGEATVFGTTMNPRQVKMMNTGFNAFYGTKIKLNQIGGRHTRKRVEVIRALLDGGAHAGLRAKAVAMRLAASTTATTIRPGAVVSHQAVAM